MLLIINPAYTVPRGYSFRIGDRLFWCRLRLGRFFMLGTPL